MPKTSAITVLILLCSTAHGYFLRGISEKSKQYPTDSRRTQVTSSSFGTSLFSELCAEFPDSNVLFSPLSVYQALALVKDGATINSTNDIELEEILGPATVRNDSNTLQKQSSEGNDSDGDVWLSMATSIWADNLTQSYINTANETQSAEAFPLPDNYTAIDDWIEDKTNGMITGLMGDDTLDPLTVALLVNAVHFKGAWTYEFNASETVNGTFTLSDGSNVETRCMSAQRDMEAIPSSDLLGGAKVVVLDYGNNTDTDTDGAGSAKFSSVFILPASPGNASMNDVISGLDSCSIFALLEETCMTEVRLGLPRFRLEFGPTKLKPSLERMGMTVAFNETIPWKFNRTNDSDPWLYIDDIYHGSCIEVSEEGTEAAAATVVEINTRGVPRVLEIMVNRPFLVIVLHRPTGIPIFIGKVENPAFFF